LLLIHIDNDGGRTSVVIAEYADEHLRSARPAGARGCLDTRLAGLNEDRA
jgi:hypothetical protein